jgi:UTP--glucose-1-phosphate uridylyltransferase
MSIRRAVITAAAPDQKSLPLQRLVDQRGDSKSALELILEESVEAGAEEICVVVCPGMTDTFRRAAGQHANRLTFIEQDNPRGYGDALFRAKDFVGDSPFLHLVSDHVFISHNHRRCAKQIVDLANQENCIVSSVQETRENMLPYFGTVGADPVGNRDDLYEVKTVIEKPTPTRAEQELIVAGLRASYYLCLSGMHVLTPGVMDVLECEINNSTDTVYLSPALHKLAQRERYLALSVQGSRYNIGVKYGLLRSQLALALAGDDRDDILTELLELVAASRKEG